MTEFDPRIALDALIGWDVQATDGERAVRDNARAVAQELGPHVPGWWESGEPPVREIARSLGSAGLLGLGIPNTRGETASALAYGLVCAELEGLDSGIRTLASVQGSLAMEAIHRYGSAETQDEWLPGLRTGELVGSFALTEPNVGSDPAAIETTAEVAPGGYALTGAKRWVSNATAADVIVTWARTPDGISAFAVPTKARGVEISPIPAKASLRTSATAEVAFDHVDLPTATHLAGALGVRAALACLNEARFGIIFGSVGAARDSLLAALDYSMTRTQFGRPLAGFQLTQDKLAWATSEAARSWQLALQIARAKDAGALEPAQISLGKYANVRSALDVARSMRTILGANGTLLSHSPIRHAANLESVLTYEGTQEMHALIVGHQLTGHAAFK